MHYAIVYYEENDGKPVMFVVSPFYSHKAACEYGDEFGGAWTGWNVVEVKEPGREWR